MVTDADIGAKVRVEGYEGMGTLAFVGSHHEKGKPRCGVHMETAVGKNNGTVGGFKYFECPDSHGVLVQPSKVTVVVPWHRRLSSETVVTSVTGPKKKRKPDAKNPIGAVSLTDVGSKVAVEGYAGHGTLMFFGQHIEKKTLRCGVVFDGPIGKNNGTVGTHKYFECPDGCGILVVPEKVTRVGRAADPATPGKATKQAKSKKRPSTKTPAAALLTAADLGSKVTVDGYAGVGTLRFVGDHAEKKIPRCGVEFEDKIGKNNGMAISTLFLTISHRHSSALYCPTCAVWCVLLGAQAYRVVVGAHL